MVTVRLAKITDLSEIVAFAARKLAPGQSTYDGIPFNAVIARRTAKEAMTDKSGRSRVWVTERDGELCGFLIGQIGEMPMSHYLAAQDLAFLADAGGDLLVKAFVGWCRLVGKVARIDMGVSASSARWIPVLRRFFRRQGFAEGGGLYYLNLINENATEVAA